MTKNGDSFIARRHFLQTSGGCLGMALIGALASSARSRGYQDSELRQKFGEIHTNLLQLVNEEREVEKLNALGIDELASKVATAHAEDMAKGDFASHWGSNGFKPYMRYSFAGGPHATQENVSAADDTWSMKLSDLLQDTSYLHVRLYDEKPPNDGHRKTILAPQHTHVGFGVAVEKLRLRLVELFVAKYVAVNSLPLTAKPHDTFVFSGRLLSASHFLQTIEVCYEPFPPPLESSWLNQSRSYSLPTDSVVLSPKLAPPLTYADGRKGVIEETPDGRFSAPIKLFRDTPGIYTIVCWVRRSPIEKAFPATEICVRAL